MEPALPKEICYRCWHNGSLAFHDTSKPQGFKVGKEGKPPILQTKYKPNEKKSTLITPEKRKTQFNDDANKLQVDLRQIVCVHGVFVHKLLFLECTRIFTVLIMQLFLCNRIEFQTNIVSICMLLLSMLPHLLFLSS